MELMTGLSEIARKHDLPIQTHVSESKAEVAWVCATHRRTVARAPHNTAARVGLKAVFVGAAAIR
jgi:cytosine/adenosine deaminase-related metal-dependent hydrolase